MRKTKGGAGVFFACKMDLGGNEKASFIYNGVRIVIPLVCAIYSTAGRYGEWRTLF